MSGETANHFSHIVCAAKTDVGLKRSNNEDAFGTFPEAGVFCVADGMGGGDDGEIASAAVVKAIGDAVAKCPPSDAGGYAGADVVELLRNGLSGASDWICRRAEEKHLNGCGSTFVGVVFDATNPAKATAVHAGDSRLYRLRGKKIVQITRDHSAAEMLGEKDERKLNPVFRSMVMNAVGVKHRVDAELTPFDVAKGDRVLICSDGLSRMVPDKKIASISCAHDDPEVALNALIDAALKAGGADNVTVVLLQVGELPPPAAALPIPNLGDDADAPTEGSGDETCPTLPPPSDPILPAESEKSEADKLKPDKSEARTERRHPPKGLIMLAVVMGTLAALALVYSLLRGDRPSSVAKGAADALAPAVTNVMRRQKASPSPVKPQDAVKPKDKKGKATPPVRKVEAEKRTKAPSAPVAVAPAVTNVAKPVVVAPAVAVPPVPAKHVDDVQAQTGRTEVAVARPHPGADAFAKACAGKSLDEFVAALRRLSPQSRLLKEVEVFSKSGAQLAMSRGARQLARTAVDLHWALKAVSDASPTWSALLAPGAAADAVKADWRMVQNSERIDEGTADDAVFAASARLIAALPAVPLAGVVGQRSDR